MIKRELRYIDMKLLWTGSDVLFATKFLKHSKKSKWIYMAGMHVFARLADLFVQEHYIVSEHLRPELAPLKLKKKITVLIDPPKYTEKFKKKPHEGFNVLYYRAIGSNQRFKDWVYGYDIYMSLKELMPELNYIETTGMQDMTKIYPIVDFYVRPNRHDGAPRMIMECETNDIPYYWSKENPDLNQIYDTLQKAQAKIR